MEDRLGSCALNGVPFNVAGTQGTGKMPVVRIGEGVGDGNRGVFAGEVGFGEGGGL